MSDGEADPIYIVTAYVEHADGGAMRPQTYHVSAPAPEEAEEYVRCTHDVAEVLPEFTQPFSGTFRLEVAGSGEAIDAALDSIEGVAEKVEADIHLEDVTPAMWPADGDTRDDFAINVAVSAWDDLEMRVKGDEMEAEHNVLSTMPAGITAHEDCTVEIVAGDQVLVRGVKTAEDGSIPDKKTPDVVDGE